MPILTPIGIQFFFSDLVNEIIIKCENRTTDTTRAYSWLKDSVLEIAGNPDYRDEFVELEQLGPTFVLTGSSSLSIQEYADSSLLPAGDINVATLDIMIWTDPPTNKTRQKLDPSHYQEADKMVIIPSLPTSWYRFGGNIGFNPTPNKNYQVQSRVLKQHPINDNSIKDTQVLLPRDWHEILVWASVERGFMELEEFEKAGNVHTLLHGDPRYPEKPGIISGRKKKRKQEAWRTSQGLRPIVRDYINR